jgi:mRNA interferase HigB
MRFISRKQLVTYWTCHPDAQQSLKASYDEAVATTWRTPKEIKDQYRSASFVGQNRVVFNIKVTTIA